MAGKDVNQQLAEAGSTAEMAEALRASGTVDELLGQIDTGEVVLTGEGGLLPGLIKLALERGLAAELTDHLGYEMGDPAGRALPISEPALDEVGPRRTGRGEVQHEAWMAGEPALHCRGLVSRMSTTPIRSSSAVVICANSARPKRRRARLSRRRNEARIASIVVIISSLPPSRVKFPATAANWGPDLCCR